ncbi:hypothetical protein [Flexivirga endophytica]|nr:hypothetical protein [Flexivirga endophytica]
MPLAARTALLDRGSRVMWRTLGRPVDLDGEHAWLAAPMHSGSRVADGWVADAAAALGGRTESDGEGGLLADLAALDGPGFSARSIDPMIRRFYEQTSGWRMEVWAQWNPLLQPGGEFISRAFGTRVQQLAIPTRPLDVAHGMDSTVVRILDGDGEQHAAAWLRTLRESGDYVYSGCYSVRSLPGSDRPSVHVAFPLESGNVQVFLRPRALPGGGLELVSAPGKFGQDGAYVVVRERGTHASRAPIHETFRLYVDDEQVLRTDHVLQLGRMTAVRLHYKLTPQ